MNYYATCLIFTKPYPEYPQTKKWRIELKLFEGLNYRHYINVRNIKMLVNQIKVGGLYSSWRIYYNLFIYLLISKNTKLVLMLKKPKHFRISKFDRKDNITHKYSIILFRIDFNSFTRDIVVLAF